MTLLHRLAGYRAGYSYLQILLVIALLAILAAVASPYYIQWQQRQRVNSTTLTLLSDLRATQTRAKQRAYNATWGVHFASSAHYYTLFHGSTYSASNSNNFTVTYPSSVSLSPDQDIVFTPVTGSLLGSDVTITVSSSTIPVESQTITINERGTIALQ